MGGSWCRAADEWGVVAVAAGSPGVARRTAIRGRGAVRLGSRRSCPRDVAEDDVVYVLALLVSAEVDLVGLSTDVDGDRTGGEE